MRALRQHQKVRDSHKVGGTSRAVKSARLLFVLGSLLVGGCMSPLHQAAGRNDIDTAKKLLDQGADVNERNRLNGATALKAASSQGNVDMVKLLLDRGADVNLASGNQGWTPLSNAAWRDHPDVAMLLIERGADINKAIAGLKRGVGSSKAVAMLNELKYKKPAPSQGQNSSAALSTQSAPTTLPPPTETATPF
jgi:ankyrin repeat protein